MGMGGASLAARRDGRWVVAMQARYAMPRWRGHRYRIWCRRGIKPLFIQRLQGAVLFHTFQDLVDAVAPGFVVQMKGNDPQGGIGAGDGNNLDVRVGSGRPGRHCQLRKIGIGTSGDGRLDGIDVGAVLCDLVAVLRLMLAQPLFLARPFVDRNDLALEVV